MQATSNLKSPLSISVYIHIFIVLVIVLLSLTKEKKVKEITKFKVIEKVVKKEAPNAISITKPKKIEKKKVKPKKKVRKVFGVQKKSQTSKSKSAIKVKKGNTVAKKQDIKKLKDSDLDKLPIPRPEYMVTSMPSLVFAPTVNYPIKAKEIGLEGRVLLEILIDEKGNVRQANIVEGLIEEMDNAAIEAIMKYRFGPAMIDNAPVAVRIQYAINFVLK